MAVADLAAAQAQRPRTAEYEFAAAANDARALWVNPAGLVAVQEASVMGDVTLEWEATPNTRISQWMLGFNSHGFGFGYQRDRFPDDPLTPENDPRSVSALRFGISLPFRRGSLGGSLSWYKGGDLGGETGWDIGIRYSLAPRLTAAGVLKNIGRPVPLDVPLPFGGIIGLTWLPKPSVLEISAEVQLVERQAGATGIDALWRGGIGFSPSADAPFTLHTAIALGNSFGIDQWLIGMSVGASARGIAMGSGPVDSGSLDFDRFSLGGVVSRAVARPRP